MRLVVLLIAVWLTILHVCVAWAEGCEPFLTHRNEQGRVQHLKGAGPIQPYSPEFHQPWLMSALVYSQPRTRALLDEGLRLTSSPEFQILKPEQQIAVLTDLIKKRISWSETVATCPLDALATFDHALALGIGNCQHLSVLLVVMLNEGGYRASLVRHKPTEGFGHIWVEVAMPDGAKVLSFVADPSREFYIRRMNEVLKIAAKDRNSLEAKWYAHPHRLYNTGSAGAGS